MISLKINGSASRLGSPACVNQLFYMIPKNNIILEINSEKMLEFYSGQEIIINLND